MTVNNGANLSKEYFISYLKLVKEARSYTLEQAQDYMVDQFFKLITMFMEKTVTAIFYRL